MKKKHTSTNKFEDFAFRLEKSLGLGGKKTDQFIRHLSKNLSPLLNKLESTILISKSIPLDMMQSMFHTYLRQIAKETGVAWDDLQETAGDLAELLKERFQPQQLLSQIFTFGQRYFFNRGEDSFVDEFGMDPSVVESVKPFFEFLYQDYWRVECHGIKNIPKEGCCLLVGNHSGMLPYDGAMIKVACLKNHPAKRDVRFLIEDFVYHFPFMGTFMSRAGAVRACPENATWLLKKNKLVLVFPEGVKGLGKLYDDRYQLQRFGRGGFIKIAIKNKAPIIPVAIIGAEEVHPIIWKSSLLAKAMNVPYLPVTPTFPWLGPMGLIPLPTKWSIYFGKPISFKQFKPAQADDALLVMKLAEKVKAQIQQMLNLGLKKRKSIWLG